ncbi:MULTISPECIES: hypothetical protein [unclassified Mesorhizobium]|uniref:hypothetical protein n=1 Tax=unclassified Mesorhizobium TaxID=325217 RepID=UPI001FDFBEED|nr:MULTISPECIES: hypothetical protein [unclassified Mesorhizobium]
MARRFAFLLVRDFTLSPLSLFIDTLRLAGDEGDRSRRIEFDWEIVGERGLPIRASCGVELLPTGGSAIRRTSTMSSWSAGCSTPTAA